MGELTPYKNYWISSYALLVSGSGNHWYARGAVSRVEPSRRTVDIKSFGPSEVFTNKEKAEAHGIALGYGMGRSAKLTDDRRMHPIIATMGIILRVAISCAMLLREVSCTVGSQALDGVHLA